MKHQKRSFLYGKNSILERLRVNPKSIKRVYLQDNFNVGSILNLVTKHKIPTQKVREKELYRIKRADRLQGILAEVYKFEYTPLEELISEGKNSTTSIIFLDDINDPHNLGSLLRITACFGDFALVIPRHSSCEVTDSVMHVASGGENYTPIAQVSNTVNAIIKAKDAGFWIAGTVVEGGENINTKSLLFPIGLVLGSEGRGIKPAIIKHLDMKITLPMKGAQLSFNVAMAGAVFCHEIDRQRS